MQFYKMKEICRNELGREERMKVRRKKGGEWMNKKNGKIHKRWRRKMMKEGKGGRN